MMSPTPETLVIASRGSKLALRQTEIISGLLEAHHPGISIEVLVVTTTGDRERSRPFAELGAKGIFTTEVERAVLDCDADVALHSAKDLTAQLAPECALICIPARADARDVVVGGDGETGEERLASLPPGARVGTSSMRRRVLLTEARPDLEVVEFRGNLDTRLRKVSEGAVDATVLAVAGIDRLGEVGVEYGALDPIRWVPAPGQGALAVEARRARSDLVELFGPLNDPASAAQIVCERAFSERLEGGCSVPLGCHADRGERGLVVTGLLGSPHSGEILRDRVSGPDADAAGLGVELADAILAAGGSEVLEDIRADERSRA